MGALANLETRMLTVAPGAEAGVEIRVRNNGTVVDQFTLDVLGDASSWATADPASLSLFPGAEERARITFRPPRSHQITAGPMPFGVRVASREDPQGSVVEEGVLQVEPFAETTAELAPRTSRGSRSAVHDLAVDNRGNTRINAEVTASDPDQVLDFDVRPPGLVIDPGTAAIANVRVRAKQSFLRGQPKTRSFSVLVGSVGQPPVAVDGTLLQEQILPGWLPRALAAALALAVLAIVLWFMFLRPAIDSAATERAKDVLAAASLPVPPGPVPPRAGGGDGGGGGGEASPTPGVTPEPGASPSPTAAGATPGPILGGGTTPADRRIPAGGSYTVEEGKTLFITDLVFSNPSATDVGQLVLSRGPDQLLILQLENFRDLDYHFVTPIVLTSGQTLSLTCDGCSAAVYYSGYQR